MEQSKKFRNQNIFLIVLGAIISIIYGGRDSNYWGFIDKSGEEILYEIGMGKTSPENLKLTANQVQEIKKLITSNPNAYNDTQKSLIVEKSGKELLREVGLGKTNASVVKLTQQQYNEISDLIKMNPSEYNEAQKSLIHQPIIK